MKQIIPFEHEIDFKTKLASITSISLEHEEKIKDSEVSGLFIIYGNYKEHTDTTEEELFKYRIPFTTILPDNIALDSVNVDIKNFTYEIIEQEKLKVNIDYLLEGKEVPIRKEIPEENNTIDELISEEYLPKIIQEEIRETSDSKKNEQEQQIEENNNLEELQEKNNLDIENDEEFITYNIHIVIENETIEDIIKKYETTIDNIKSYNDITNIKIGDKILIPQILNE